MIDIGRFSIFGNAAVTYGGDIKFWVGGGKDPDEDWDHTLSANDFIELSQDAAKIAAQLNKLNAIHDDHAA